MRLDKFLFNKYDLKSRTYAENLIKTGCVSVNGAIVTRTSLEVDDGDEVEVRADMGYASQGAYKLEEAFVRFGLDVKDKYCLDLGCSNGGFTDCLLRHGAGGVLAVDVAECALEGRLLESGKVTFLRANARELPNDIGPFDFVCSDLSFISVTYALGEIYRALKAGGEAVVLVKPQFELNRAALDKQGVVKTEKLRLAALNSVRDFAKNSGFEIVDTAIAPIRFENKNIEYLLRLAKRVADDCGA